MGIFSRRSRKTETIATNRTDHASVVTVAFRDLGTHDPLKNFAPEHGYAYLWPFPSQPQVGQWAIADGWDGPKPVIVGSIGLAQQARGMQLKPLRRLISPTEVSAAQAMHDTPKHAWLDLARQVAGLPCDRPIVDPPPPEFDALPPVEGSAGPEVADERGRIWWRAYSLATELGRDPAEVAAFKAAGQGWFRERDRAVKVEQNRRIARAVASTDLEAAIRDVDSRSRVDIEAMRFAGQHLADWLKHAQELDNSGRQDEALSLLGALISAAEQEAALSGREPAPAYTERAAMIHRKRRDYAAEIAVVERWLDACPPAKRGPGATQARLIKRLDRARQLAPEA